MSGGRVISAYEAGVKALTDRSTGLARNRPISPRPIPYIMPTKLLRDQIDPMGTTRTTTDDTEKAHEATGPKAVAGNRLIGIFRTGRKMPAGISNKAGQGKLIKAHQRGAEHAPRRSSPGSGPVSRTGARYGNGGPPIRRPFRSASSPPDQWRRPRRRR